MITQVQISLLLFYGAFLILCGIISVIFIGLKAKTALISGGISGLLSIASASLIYLGYNWGIFCGIFLSTALFIVFSWRCTKTFFRLFEMIQEDHRDLKGKGIAFLIIGLMAVTSLFTLVAMLVSYSL